MLSVSTNIGVIAKAKLEQIQALQNNPDPILRAVAMAVTPELKERVHIKGLDSNGSPIGTYSAGYMVVRTGNYKNSGKNDSGYRTKGNEAIFDVKSKKAIKVKKKDGETNGSLRPKYNRTADTKVIISLTRQMENDLAVCENAPIKTSTGYGIGYLNPDNRKKADYVEATYNKKILTKLTKEEKELAIKTATEFLTEYLKTI